MLRFAWKRLLYYFHERCGGVLRDRDRDSGVVIWRCVCGVELGRTDLSIDPPKCRAHRGRSA